MSYLNKFSLKGKVALVTGTSTGLGQGITLGFIQAGAKVVGVDYMPTQDDTAEKVKALGGEFTSLQADLIKATPEDLQALVEKAVKIYGKLDILVNNAGIIRREDALDFSKENWYDVMAINIDTVFFLSQAVGRQYVKQGTGGKIISIASMLSYQGGIRVPSYTASKSAVKGLTMALANEWSKHNIQVNAIAPGYMATNNTKQLRDDETRAGQILERIPAGRWGTPEDVAAPAVFLASSASDYITGFTIAVDGGWLAR
ncbi:2-dehydro-3-deoxy-D-gluconate 5-dehydrogenase KduD [Acholeplasma equirhinis]|uniref:2-dehydro-3-deoxy-D-gluconate 5-dehydrogenase KduD n=1 Tax=Acholeplasma equirhinis TaxID=555393 RepID=UPI00197ADEE0|nr:2-dehydro-3-deoxy-D-gluconate 5-dehydrogenase KduD [Acholeplasma equirhinis]MBN3490726.1 2-dehydro-3-deoxy-D-gluconate 5-dehydrogenase KduD [Acholeplasma equirhinis]